MREVGSLKARSAKPSCERCADTGWLDYASITGQEDVPLPPGTSNLFFYDHPGMHHSTLPCPCRTEAAIQARVDSIFDGSAGVPDEYQDLTFESWDALPARWRRDKGDMRQVAEAFAAGNLTEAETGKTKWGLVLGGPTGRGKSGLAAAVLRRRAEQGQAVLWIDFRQFLRHAYRTIRPNTEWDYEAVVGAAAEVDFLVWDDFADQEQKNEITDYVRNVVYDVIGQRHSHHRATLITTNLDPSLVYGQFGDRVGDRVLQMSQWQQAEGDNLRFSRLHQVK